MGRLFGTDGVRGRANADLTPELALALAVAVRQRWSLVTLFFALAATLPPFLTVFFDRWAHRSGRYEERAAS